MYQTQQQTQTASAAASETSEIKRVLPDRPDFKQCEALVKPAPSSCTDWISRQDWLPLCSCKRLASKLVLGPVGTGTGMTGLLGDVEDKALIWCTKHRCFWKKEILGKMGRLPQNYLINSHLGISSLSLKILGIATKLSLSFHRDTSALSLQSQNA